MLTYTPTHIHTYTHHDKVIAISVPPYYVVSTDTMTITMELDIWAIWLMQVKGAEAAHPRLVRQDFNSVIILLCFFLLGDTGVRKLTQKGGMPLSLQEKGVTPICLQES